MLELIKEYLGPHYLIIKFVHVFAVMAWSWSTAVAYTSYLKPAYIKWRKNPADPILLQRRDWAFEQFDRGAVIEHTAFPVLVISGGLLFALGGWDIGFHWLMLKLSIVVLIFFPIEIADYWLSHMGGNKYRIRASGDAEKYQRYIQHHWHFFRITTPLITLFMPMVIFLAIVKPAFN
ncbi:MAG: hypothetical protein CSH49_20080 [Alcanivorax sp.]|nr:MAG: hypothetical protein CSH49_20080 [Alcanivorax sp.]